MINAMKDAKNILKKLLINGDFMLSKLNDI